MEGVNMGGILLGYLACFVLALALLLSLGLLVAALTKAARMVCASGLLAATAIAALAALAFFDSTPNERTSNLTIALAALALLLAGAGPFVGALRSGRVFGVALGYATVALLLAASPLLGGDSGAQIPGARFLVAASLFHWPWPSLLLAAAGLASAVLLPARSPQMEPAHDTPGGGR